MKINWNKLWNPNNIDFEALKKMSPEELNSFTKELYDSELAKIWVRFTFLLNYLCFTNTWQYILAIWLSK